MTHPTQRLYFDDAYLRAFEARVVALTEWHGQPAVVLDATALYPEGGGQPGRLCRTILNPGPNERELPAKTLLTIHRGDVFRHELAGAGGWGDPLERDPERVLADVLNEKVTVEGAREGYGVILDPVGGEIDQEATRTLRASRRRPT